MCRLYDDESFLFCPESILSSRTFQLLCFKLVAHCSDKSCIVRSIFVYHHLNLPYKLSKQYFNTEFFKRRIRNVLTKECLNLIHINDGHKGCNIDKALQWYYTMVPMWRKYSYCETFPEPFHSHLTSYKEVLENLTMTAVEIRESITS